MSGESTALDALRSELDALLHRSPEGAARVESHSMGLLRCLLAGVPDYIAIFAPDGTILFLNRVFEGLTLEATIGKSAYDYQAPAARAAYRACVEGVVRTGQPDSIDAEVHLGDGRVVRFDTRFGPVRDGDQVIAVTVIATDVTASRQALRALRESQAKLRMAVDTAGIGLWTRDTRTNQVAWEDALCAIFGLPPGTAPVGLEGYMALVHPEDREHAAQGIARGAVAGDWEDEYRVVRADGAVRWVMVKGTSVPGEGGAVVLGAMIDVTERRERDEQRRQAQKLEAVGQLTAGIAHNFNNMLMGILPNLELAARAAPPALVDLLQSAQDSALRAADLVRQLMTYAGRDRPTVRTAESLGTVAERAVAICRTTFDRRIAFEVRADPQARACVDAAQVEQALLNLLINARDSFEGGAGLSPRVVVDVAVVPSRSPELAARPASALVDHVRIRVTDNGAGMDAATVARIYEPFFTTKEVGKGTGLGLATTHAIVREHGGWITCDSAPGAGTTFSIYLARDATAAEPAKSEPPPAPPRGVETILIVDDEPTIRHVVALMLEGAGFTARMAASGLDAIDLLADARVASEVALILLDVSMPGMSARDLRNRLAELAPRARIVYFTGYAFDAADPGDVVLEKPVTEAQLLGTIREVLDRRASAIPQRTYPSVPSRASP